MTDNFFLKMIRTLRHYEDVMLYGNILDIKETESIEVIEFLENEYQCEVLNYPYEVPAYNAEASLWAAKTVYTAAQLMLYRENKEADLPFLLPDFLGEFSASAILSSDLCLRFLPDMLTQLKFIDSEDPLIQILENKLRQFHYSGISYPLEIERLDFRNVGSNKCLQQLYINRIIENKKIQLADHPECKDMVFASLGFFAQEFWNELKIQQTPHE